MMSKPTYRDRTWTTALDIAQAAKSLHLHLQPSDCSSQPLQEPEELMRLNLISRHHVQKPLLDREKKDVPSNIFTFAPPAPKGAEEKGVSGRLF